MWSNFVKSVPVCVFLRHACLTKTQLFQVFISSGVWPMLQQHNDVVLCGQMSVFSQNH